MVHYDQDYDTLAELMGFDSVWLAPAGTLTMRAIATDGAGNRKLADFKVKLQR